MRHPILILGLIVLALSAGLAAASFQPHAVLIGAAAVLISAVAFINIELGLYILIFSMLLSPEIMVGETAGGTGGRGITLRFEDFLLMIIGASWFAKNVLRQASGLFLRTPINKAILCYMLICLSATMLGIMAGRVEAKTGLLFVLKYVEYFIVYFMVANHVRSANQVKRLLVCLFLTALIVAVVAMVQTPLGERVSAPFEGEIGEPNTFGGYLLFIGCVAAGLLTKTEDVRLKWLLVLLLFFLVPPFLLTQSRTSYLAAIPACLTLGLIADRRAIIAGLVLAFMIVSPLFLPEIVKQRIMYTFNQPEEPGQIRIGDLRLDTSTSARLTSWQEAVADWTKQPVLGYGVTGYAFIDAQFPRVMVETGLVGFAAFLYLLGSVFRMVAASLQQVTTPSSRGLTLGFLAGFVGLLVHALGANTFIIVRIMEPFWFLAGMVAVLPALEVPKFLPKVAASGTSGPYRRRFSRPMGVRTLPEKDLVHHESAKH